MRAPNRYECKTCGSRGVKLWREYQTFQNHQTLLCRSCSEIEQAPKNGGRPSWEEYGGDQIGWRVPAVPDKLPTGIHWKLPRGYTFWGYTSVPADGVEWWKRLHGIGRVAVSLRKEAEDFEAERDALRAEVERLKRLADAAQDHEGEVVMQNARLRAALAEALRMIGSDDPFSMREDVENIARIRAIAEGRKP